MKKLCYLLLLIFCFSCQKDEMLYSCDPNVEKWTAEKKLEINKMNREQFLGITNISYKKAAYRAFTLENKQKIWKEKLQELKKLNWSDAEWKHIVSIYSLVLNEKKTILGLKEVEDNDELLIFSYRWEEYARTILRWNKKQIYAICYTVEKMINKQGDLAVNVEHRVEVLARNETGGGGGFECSCSQKSSYCDIIDHEGPPYTTCRTPSGGSCIVTSGCGLFWQFDCDGMCLGLNV